MFLVRHYAVVSFLLDQRSFPANDWQSLEKTEDEDEEDQGQKKNTNPNRIK
jgi:hypothetical protein